MPRQYSITGLDATIDSIMMSSEYYILSCWEMAITFKFLQFLMNTEPREGPNKIWQF